MDSNILDNFEKHIFYHGTTLDAAVSIVKNGFQIWDYDKYFGRYAKGEGGNHGKGIYLTCNWKTAFGFGPTLLRVSISPGTKLLNSAISPDAKIINYLKREFGKDILRKPSWKVLPKNKKLKLNELINLFRYHYWHAWEKLFRGHKDWDKWPQKRDLHWKLLNNYASILKRYGFHGYGNPDDYNGIVIFADDRLLLKEVVAHIPGINLVSDISADSHNFTNIDAIRDYFGKHGTYQAKKLAEKVAAANSSII